MNMAGFAKIMGTMWKELLDAMPLGMGHMIKDVVPLVTGPMINYLRGKVS